MKHWLLWLVAGVISLLGGLFALANPLAATLTAELLAGYMFILVGVLTLISAFGDQGWGGRILTILLGLLILFLGINLVAHPLAGMVSLTALAGVTMLVMGLFRILIAFSEPAKGLRGVLIVSGLLSLLLGGMIFANWPQSAAVVLGLFLAVELISNGVSLIVLSMVRKSAGGA